jgi:hypothetical protein
MLLGGSDLLLIVLHEWGLKGLGVARWLAGCRRCLSFSTLFPGASIEQVQLALLFESAQIFRAGLAIVFRPHFAGEPGQIHGINRRVKNHQALALLTRELEALAFRHRGSGGSAEVNSSQATGHCPGYLEQSHPPNSLPLDSSNLLV